MTPREQRLLIAVALLIGATWWFISLTNACMTLLKIFPKGSCIWAFSLNFGATTFWFYNLLAVLALYAAFHLYKTLPAKDLKPEHPQSKEPQPEVVADLANANYKVHLIDKYGIFKNEVLAQYVCDNKLFETVDAALEHAHKLNQESRNNPDTFDGDLQSAKSPKPPSGDGRDCQDRKYQKELERYNISFDVSTQRYIFQNQRYFDAETAVLAAQADEQRAKSRELELSELAKHGIQFDATADRYIYQGQRYMEAKEALDAAAMLERYNISFDVSTQRYIFQNQRYFDAETAVLAAQAEEQRAKSRELELSELAKHGIQFDATADRYIYQGRRYMEAKEALDAAAISDEARRSGVIDQGLIGSTGLWRYKEYESGRVVAESNSGQQLSFASMSEAEKYFNG